MIMMLAISIMPNCHLLTGKAETLQQASKVLGASAAFVPVKLTALLSPSLLERMALLPAAGAGSEALRCDPREGLSSEDILLFNEVPRVGPPCLKCNDSPPTPHGKLSRPS